MAYLVSLGLLLLLGVKEWQHHKIVSELLNRLLVKEGFEPIAEPKEEDVEVRKHIPSKEELLEKAAKVGAVRFKMPGVIPGK